MRQTPIVQSALASMFLSFLLVACGTSKAKSSASVPGRLRVVTFNTGLAKYVTIPLVPCVSERIEPQLVAIFDKTNGLFADLDLSTHPFIVTLQEVWTEEAYTAYTDLARTRGFSYFPTSFTGISSNGLLTIGSKITSHEFKDFTTDDLGRSRGIRLTSVPVGSGEVVVGNLHTSYSAATSASQIQARQFDEIVTIMNSESSAGPTLIAGDFNAGPNLHYWNETYDPTVQIWQTMLIGRLSSHWTHASPPENALTWDTAGNPLVNDPAPFIKSMYSGNGGRWEEKDSTLDHIFASTPLVTSAPTVVLDRQVAISGCPSHAPEGLGYLSDHYGVKVDVLRP